MPVIENLRRAEAGLVAELARVNAERADLGEQLRGVRGALRALGQGPNNGAGPSEPVGAPRALATRLTPRPAPGSRGNLDLVVDTLHEIGRPATLAEIREWPSLRAVPNNSVRWALQRLRKSGRAAVVGDDRGMNARWQLTSDP